MDMPGGAKGTPSFPGPLNLGNPAEFTILALAEQIIDLTGATSHIGFQPRPADDPTQRKPDITRAPEYLGWSPRVKIEDGLKKTIAYFDKLLQTPGR
jgi:UDP-glucuronate decarboxylase